MHQTENDGCENLSKKVEQFFVRKETIKNQSVTMPRKNPNMVFVKKVRSIPPKKITARCLPT